MGISRAADGTLSMRADRLPGSVWGSNLRAVLPASRWVSLSRATAKRAGRVCEVCGKESAYGDGTRNPDCHELWSFDVSGDRAVQRLSGVVALCGACHETQHSGLADLNGRSEAVIYTLMRVNGWSDAEARADVAESVEEYRRLSAFDWDLDLALLQGWVELEGYPRLIVPTEEREVLGNSLDKRPRKLSIVVGADIPAVLWSW